MRSKIEGLDSFQIGEEVMCDLDGKLYFIVSITDRNIAEKRNPDDPPKLLGNVLLLKDRAGNKVHVYEWEVSKCH